MSFKKTTLFTPNPTTARGVGVKLSAGKDKVVYTSGRSVIIRDFKNPELSTVYSGHIQPATVARISPTGYYCASADVTGKVNVWDLIGGEQILKGEYRVISGRINDLAWDGESKRIIAVGDGKEKFAHAFMFDTGSATGEILGHSKAINAVSIRAQRPFKAVTAGDDTTIAFHSGVPFKHEKTIKSHTKFVQDVKYSPSGDLFASVGSDGKLFIYDGKTGETLMDVPEGHTGTVFSVSWSPDSKQLFTSSADGTVKLWDATAHKNVSSWTVGSGVDYQQVGGTWSGDSSLVSLSMNGDLNVFDARIGNGAAVVHKAPQISITTLARTSPSTSTKSETFLAGTVDGRVYSYNSTSLSTDLVNDGGKGHTANVSGLAVSNDGGKVYSIGFDDQLREIETTASSSGPAFIPASTPTTSQPKSLAVGGDETVFVLQVGVVEAFRSNQRVAEFKPPFEASAIAASGNNVAIGGEDRKVRLYTWNGTALTEVGIYEGNQGGIISTLAFSPDGKYLVGGDSSGKILLYDAQGRTVVTTRWSGHSARINSFAWTADSVHLASGSLDTHVYVWSTKNFSSNIPIRNAGPGGINGALWLDGGVGQGGKLVSAGFDGVVRNWDITFRA